MISQFSYCSNLKVSDLIFALQILLCGAGEGLAELSTLFSLIFLWQQLETERTPQMTSCCCQQRTESPPLIVSQVLSGHARFIHTMFHSGSLHY